MMKIAHVLIILICSMILLTDNLQAACGGSSPNLSVASPYDAGDVQDCVDDATDGDTITLPACDVSWSSTVTIPNTKGVEIVGAGVGNSKITGSGAPKFLIQIASGSTTYTRISGIEFYGTALSPAIAHAIVVVQTTLFGSQSTRRYRIDNCTFEYHHGLKLWGNAYGLIDNCVFHYTVGNSGYMLWYSGRTGKTTDTENSNDTGYQCWSEQVQYGSEYFHAVEDCTFQFDSYAPAGHNWNDGNSGGKLLIRKNTILNGAMFGGHDSCPNDIRGVHALELYDNDWYIDVAPYALGLPRGGTRLMYDNRFRTASSSWGGGIEPVIVTNTPFYFQNPVYRYTSGTAGCQGIWIYGGACGNGSADTKICLQSIWKTGAYGTPCSSDADCTYSANDKCVYIDGLNVPDGGYPCRDQWGYTHNDMIQQPIMGWNNKHCVNDINCTPNTYAPITWGSAVNDIVKTERDVIDYNSVAASGTCSDGVDNDGDGNTDMADQNCIDFWDNTNNKLKDYTPLQYPHPLRGTILPVISNSIPSGTQTCTGPTQSVTLGVNTNEASTCIYSPVDDDFLDMSNYNSGVTFTTTGGTSHSGATTLASNASYIFYATCMDTSGVSNGASGTQIYFNINECTPVVEQGQVISPGVGRIKTVAPSTPGSGVFKIK